MYLSFFSLKNNFPSAGCDWGRTTGTSKNTGNILHLKLNTHILHRLFIYVYFCIYEFFTLKKEKPNQTFSQSQNMLYPITTLLCRVSLFSFTVTLLERDTCTFCLRFLNSQSFLSLFQAECSGPMLSPPPVTPLNQL